jgi:hypothetical protein
MGAWGTGPFDNDGAADLIIKLMKPVDIVLSAHGRGHARNFYRYNDARAACMLVAAAHGTDILGGPDIHRVLACLRLIRADDEFIETWSSTRRIVEALERDIRKVKRIIAKCKACRAAAKRTTKRTRRVT